MTYKKSAIGYTERTKRTIRALGFTKLGQTLQHTDSPQLRGMLNAVKHLVVVVDVE
ncbi:MAG: 50S ribosomal protein L30 [Chloroflexi bacterium]|nr:50S ribosomal protein L30 [Chloroflexota bacterium]